jgi:hypothetical protein
MVGEHEQQPVVSLNKDEQCDNLSQRELTKRRP